MGVVCDKAVLRSLSKPQLLMPAAVNPALSTSYAYVADGFPIFTFIQGITFNDTLQFGDATAQPLLMGMANETDFPQNVLGLGFSLPEDTWRL